MNPPHLAIFCQLGALAMLLPSLALAAAPSPRSSSLTPEVLVLTYKVEGDRNEVRIHTGEGRFDYRIDWDDDGVWDEHLDGPATHTYARAGTYTVRIAGDFPHANLCKTHNTAHLIDVKQWGRIAWRSMREMFSGCEQLERWSARDLPDLSQVSDMSGMFSWSYQFDQPLDAWDVSQVTSMKEMFLGAMAFNQPLDAWDVSQVQNMAYMFAYTERFDQALERWDTRQVTDMSHMFEQAAEFNHALASWDVSQVTTMSAMFRGTPHFDQPLAKWDVSQVTDMSHMFEETAGFDQPLESWDVSQVSDLTAMFYRAYAFDQPLGAWPLSKARKAAHFLDQSAMSQANYDATLIGWAAQKTLPPIFLPGVEGMRYCDASVARQYLMDDHIWNFVGDTLSCKK